MMRLQSSLLLSLTFSLVLLPARECSVAAQQQGVRGAQFPSERTSRSRRLMGDMGMGGGKDKNKGGGNNFNNNAGIGREFETGNNNGQPNNSGLIEPGNCVVADHPDVVVRRSNALTDPECVSNSCNGGCCRLFHWLMCDESNSFDHLQCVCNVNTSPPPPTPFPTNPPSPFPTTGAPTSAEPTTGSPTSIAPSTGAPTLGPPTTPVPTVEIVFNFTDDNSTVAVDREDTDEADNTITFDTPAPVTATPTTATPTTLSPTTASPTTAPVTAAPTTAMPTPVPGPLQAWQQCAAGSVYHANFGASNTCNYAEDCAVKDECCIRNFCLCGNPNGLTSECVPSRFL